MAPGRRRAAMPPRWPGARRSRASWSESSRPVPATLTRTATGAPVPWMSDRQVAATRSASRAAPASSVSGRSIWKRALATRATRSVARESWRSARAIGPAMVRQPRIHLGARTVRLQLDDRHRGRSAIASGAGALAGHGRVPLEPARERPQLGRGSRRAGNAQGSDLGRDAWRVGLGPRSLHHGAG